MLKTSQVFGVNTDVNEHSYIDRGNLDNEISRLSNRDRHISLRGESKCGKSWLRQKNFPSAAVVQSRIDFSKDDIFTSILAALDINLKISKSRTLGGSLEFTGSGEAGWKLIAKAQAAVSANGSFETTEAMQPVGKDANDLRFICEIIRLSGRRVVIEDFHYLSTEVQRQLAHDLKAMWDYGVYVIIIGVWVKRNYLTHLNSDLAGRITEINVYWSIEELASVVKKGSASLCVDFSDEIIAAMVSDCFGNVGLIQTLALETLDQSGVFERSNANQECKDIQKYEDAALTYAEQLEAVYLEFARRVSSGIRQRKGSTKIYAHAMWAIFDSTDDQLISGVDVDTIFSRAHSRQNRIQKGNLRLILKKLDGLQIDDRGKGLVVTFVEQSDSVATVDRSVLFYRKYCTVKWPWQDIIAASDDDDVAAD